MSMNFPESFKNSLVESFKQASFTESSMSHDLDAQFSGVRTVHVMSLRTEPLQDYNRSVDPSQGSRYGAVKEVQDEVQTFEMTQDKSFTLSIDKGNNKEQLNMKQVGAVMKAQKEDVIIPWLDKYRLERWAAKAGIHMDLGAALTKTNIVEKVINAHNEMADNGAPVDGCTLYIARKYLPYLKLSPEWTNLDSLGGKVLPSGSVGDMDGMAVKPIPTSKMPENVAFMIVHKAAVFAPIKVQDMKGHVDPPGLSGDLLEFRLITDAFVLGKKAAGVLAGCEQGKVCAVPTFGNSSGNITITAGTSGATIYYTLDGSDPRYSRSVKTYTSAITLKGGEKLRAYNGKTGLFDSAVADYN